MKKNLPSFAVAALIALGGYVHGIWTDRWSMSQSLEKALERLAALDPPLRDWKSNPLPLDARQSETAGFLGCFLRRFENPRNGHAVTVLVACGRAGTISMHSPELCYAGAGYAMAANPARGTIGGQGTDEFWTVKFTKAGAVEGIPLRLFWCWRSSGGWEAPDSPRLRFAGQSYLYKLYVIQELTSSDEATDEHAKEFLRELMPALNQGLDLP